MNLLVSLNSNYIYPLCVLFRSIADTNPHTHLDIFVAYSSLTDDDFSAMEEALGSADATIHKKKIDENIFAGAPVLSRISKETYYRLLIGDFIGENVDRLLYIDPDVVVKAPLDGLYNIDMQGKMIAAGTHMTPIVKRFNQLRLHLKRSSEYVNAGIMLIDMKKWRETVSTQEIINFIADNYKKLLLGDQDVVNMMFEDDILCIDERKYNLDEKTYSQHSGLFCKDKIDLDWVKKNTIIIHYNGKKKPWREENYKGKLGEYFEQYK